MRKDKIKAIKLRREGNSYSQISKIIGAPKSTLSYWLRDIQISKKAQQKINKLVSDTSIKALVKRNKNQTIEAIKRSELIKKEARKEFSKFKDNKLFLIGLSLYWAEGYKKGAYGSKWKGVDFANSDPEMIKLMMIFFEKICNIKKESVHIQVIAHQNIEINKAVNYWKKITGIPKKQFIKTYQNNKLKNNKGRKNNTLTYGTAHIRINNVKLFFRIIGWIEELKKMRV